MRYALLLVLLLVFVPPVRAELPPHNPEMLQPDAGVPAATELKQVRRGPIEFYTIQFSDGQSLEIKEGLDFGYHLEDIILPEYQERPEEIALPDIEAMATYVQNAQYLLMPQHVTSNTIHWSTINQNIRSDMFCARIFNQSAYSNSKEDVTSITPQLSENFEYSQELWEGARKFYFTLGLGEFEPVNGFYDFNLAPEITAVKDARPFCLWKRKSTPLGEKELDITQLATWTGEIISVMGYVWETIGEWVTTVLEDGSSIREFVYELFTAGYKAYFTEVSVLSNVELFAMFGDALGKEIFRSPHKFIQETPKKRGFAFSMLPEHRSEDLDQKLEENRYWQTEYKYTIFGRTDGDKAGQQVYGDKKKKSALHPTLLGGNANARLKQMLCSTVPQEALDKGNVLMAHVEAAAPDASANILTKIENKIKLASINEFCGPPVQPTPPVSGACPIDILSKASGAQAGGGSCNLCNTNALSNYLTDEEQQAIPNGLSPLALKVLNAAGNAYNVPASMLLATMLHEGAFNASRGLNWSDDESVRQYSDCNNPEAIPNCSSQTSSSGASGPFGFLPNIWDRYMASGSPYEGVDPQINALDDLPGIEGRSKDSMSPCNFVDAAFMAARAMFEDSSHAFGPVPQSCTSSFGTYNVYQGNSRPASCSDWNTDRAAVTRLQYGDGVCSEDTGRVVSMYDAMHCGN